VNGVRRATFTLFGLLMRITYIGHATLLLELAGRRLLTDPNFDTTLGRFLPRVSAPGIALDALPSLDALLLTHAHADHLSFASLDRLPRDVPLFAPPAVARWLQRAGYAHAVPLAADASAAVHDVTVHAAAARHVGSRYGFDRWRGATNMYLLETPDSTLFFAGDTALTPDTHRLVAERLHAHGRTLDVALLPIGHAPWWKPGFRRGHLTSADALTLFERLGARYLVPYHWGTFHHVTATAFDGITRLRELLVTHGRAADVRILEPGQSLEVEPGGRA
jgi:L-ascorbate metabolism protein UlaG (beta-lactamase superfamily)